MGYVSEPSYEVGGCYAGRAFEVKALMEVAKLNGITVNDDLFNRVFDKVYEKPDRTVVSESTTKTRTENP